MSDLHPGLLTILSYFYLGKAFLQHRNSATQEARRRRTGFYEKIWQEAAAHVGATIEPLGYGIFEIRFGDSRIRVSQNYTSIDDPVTLALAGKKALVYKLLAQQGLPTPSYEEFSLNQMSKAFAFLAAARGACVVKPARDTGAGQGVTTGIRSRSQLVRAAAAAAAYKDHLLIEEQIEGNNYRLLYLDGRLLDAIMRKPATVTGDGKSTIGALVQRANADRAAHGIDIAQNLLTVDMDMRHTLARQGLSLASVPKEGTIVTLKTVINENCRIDNISAKHALCASVIESGARAATAIGARLAGVDIITHDPGIPLVESGGVILEVNTTPGYHYHYYKADGEFPVALHVLEALLTTNLVGL
jgi:cyanophycin synthetase